MTRSGNRQEWKSTAQFLHILSNDKIQLDHTTHLLLHLIRSDESGIVMYRFNHTGIITVIQAGEQTDISQADCKKAAETIESELALAVSFDIEIPVVSTLLTQLRYTWFYAITTEKRYDFSVSLLHSDTESYQTINCSIKPSLGEFSLLCGQRTTNFKYDILNIKLATPEVNKINRFETPYAVRDRLEEIERRGGKLKFTSPEEKNFQSNLSMIDLHLPKLLSEIVRLHYTLGLSAFSELIKVIKQSNPFKLKEELISKHYFYEFKAKQLLYALATGMRPTRIYRGYNQTAAWVTTEQGGNLSIFSTTNRAVFDEMLYQHARLEEADPDATKSGYIEKENGQWLFKLNLQISI